MSRIHDRISIEGRAVLSQATSKTEKRQLQRALAFMADESTECAFSHPMMCLTILPYKPTPPDAIWERSSDFAKLAVHPVRDEETGQYLGVPYGAKARLILLFLQAQAIKNNSRQVDLGKSMHDWLARMGVRAGGKTYKLVRAQASRIENSLIRFSYRMDDGKGRWQDSIVRGSFDPTGGERIIELSEGFFRALTDHPVPLDEAAIRELGDTCLPLDLYLWLAYRLHILERPSMVSWKSLHQQFGGGTQELYHFKQKFPAALDTACSVYPDARVEKGQGGVRLFPSPPPVAKRVSHLRSLPYSSGG
jgi:hypothetical protein